MEVADNKSKSLSRGMDHWEQGGDLPLLEDTSRTDSRDYGGKHMFVMNSATLNYRLRARVSRGIE